MRVLVTGAGGQLGVDLVRCCEVAGDEVTAADSCRRSTSPIAMPCTAQSRRCDPMSSSTARRGPPSTPARAIPTGRYADERLWPCAGSPRAAIESVPDLVQISTDYVFDGSLDRPYHEWDETVSAERLRQHRSWPASARRWRSERRRTVVRTSWVCGQHGANMVTTIMRLADAAHRVGVRRRPDRPPDLHRRPRADGAPSRRRSPQRDPPRHQPDGRRAGTGSPAMSSRRWARAPTWCGRSPPPSCSRRARRAGRPTACSTTPCCGCAGLPLLRDFHEPLGETVRALS